MFRDIEDIWMKLELGVLQQIHRDLVDSILSTSIIYKDKISSKEQKKIIVLINIYYKVYNIVQRFPAN